ncbi:MAG TPA: response regulator transcription factor [Vicinamibacterales bacterium]|nr:response regulator transcription factor [Vicinamibacterales bacterium]
MSSPTKTTAILIIDDHAIFRESVARLLDREPDLTVVGHVGGVDEGLAILARRRIDLVLLDFDLGERDGLDFLRRVKHAAAAVKVLIVTAEIQPHQAADAIRAGVSGVFLKRDSAHSLIRIIRDVMAGKVSFDQELFAQAIADEAVAAPLDNDNRFSDRQREVLARVLEGLANKEIAARIGITENSVKATLQHLFAKTGVRTRSQLVRVTLERNRRVPP